MLATDTTITVTADLDGDMVVVIDDDAARMLVAACAEGRVETITGSWYSEHVSMFGAYGEVYGLVRDILAAIIDADPANPEWVVKGSATMAHYADFCSAVAGTVVGASAWDMATGTFRGLDPDQPYIPARDLDDDVRALIVPGTMSARETGVVRWNA